MENAATKVARWRGSAVAGCVHATTLVKLASRSSPQLWWMTRSSRRSERAIKCRNSFRARIACSRSMRTRLRASWSLPRSWRASQTTRGFGPTFATTQCMQVLSARARGTWGSTTPAAGCGRVPRSWLLEIIIVSDAVEGTFVDLEGKSLQEEQKEKYQQ